MVAVNFLQRENNQLRQRLAILNQQLNQATQANNLRSLPNFGREPLTSDPYLYSTSRDVRPRTPSLFPINRIQHNTSESPPSEEESSTPEFKKINREWNGSGIEEGFLCGP